MILGVDASNIRNGGTVTHLIELLRAANPPQHGFETVVVWGGSGVLARIESRPWLNKVVEPLLEQSVDPFLDRRHLLRMYWQRVRLPKLAAAAGCDGLFVPGGLDFSGFRPLLTMSQNFLPFDWSEARRFGLSPALLRIALLRLGQSCTFRRAAGTIFLTQHARTAIAQACGLELASTAIVPHGVGVQFFEPPRPPRTLAECSKDRPLRIVYVSTVDFYKHQWNVAEAVSQLRESGLPVALDMAGPANKRALPLLQDRLMRLDPKAAFLRYLGPIAYDQQPRFYRSADLVVFASSCENLPIILLEGMAAGLPIACSNRGPMPEVLGDAGVYFDPESPAEIAQALRKLSENPELRASNAQRAFERARQYSWSQCATITFAFLGACISGSSSQ